MDDTESRLHRIEQKIDSLSDAMVSLARAEEKLVAMERSNNVQYERLNAHALELDKLRDQCSEVTNVAKNNTKILWSFIGATGTILALIFAEVLRHYFIFEHAAETMKNISGMSGMGG